MTDAELDQCRHDGALLRSIVADQVKLKREGREWKGLCPFHDETTPSFTVYEDGHFHCFGCGAHGTSFDYVMKRDGVEFPEAAKRVAAEIGATPSRAKPEQPTNGNGTYTGAIWQPIVPPPADAPLPTADQLRCDTLHEYRDADDRVLCYVRRVEAKNGKGKLFLPLTYGVLDGKPGWHTKAPDKPKPLYGLNRLAFAPDAAVLICEGEKSADAAQRLFPDMVAMSWMGGVNGDGGADLVPLAGHNVILWGDADEVGAGAVARLLKRLPEAHWVDSTDLPDGFDAADLERDGCADPEAWLAERAHDAGTREGEQEPPAPEQEGGEPPLHIPEEPEGQEPDPLQAAINRLAVLPELHYDRIDETTKAATAEKLGLTVGALKRAVTRARKAAKEKADADAKAREKVAKERLTGAARQAELERLADLKEDDPLEYDEQREAAAGRIGCRVTTLDDVINKIIEDRDAQRRLNNPPTPSGPTIDTPEVTALIAEFNARYFVLSEAGKTIIYAPKRDDQLHRDYFERITFDDFQRLYLNRFVKTGVSERTGGLIFSQAANVWLRHRDRRQYIGGMVFDPSGRPQPDDVLNLWQGFGVEPKPSSCRLFKEHLRNVICCGSTNLYEYVLDWCADAVQHPDRRGQVALVLCGPEGTGKGIFANAMKYLFGQHGLAISNAKHLVGHFNAHLRDTVLLFADEAFYAGDRAHTSILKAIITESEMVVEAKYQNAAPAKNYLHIIMASNEPWVVPASLDSRRFAVIAVATSKMGDLTYFAAIQHELEHGGYEAFLAELLDRVPSGDIRQIPVTDALVTQRKLSLDTTEAWWLDCLHRGYVFTSVLGLEDHFHEWLDPISMELLHQSYEAYCRAHGERHPLSRELLGRWMHTTAGCRPVRPARSMVGEHITDATTTGSNYSSRVAEPVWKDRAYGYEIGDLDAARTGFLKATGLTVEWPRGEE